MKVEIAIPCYNEEATVAKVIKDFSKAAPEADIVVYNNNSTDETVKCAKGAGAHVVNVSAQGKGHVIREIFDTSSADIIVLVDGDDTYEAADVHNLIEPLVSEGADMTVGTRLHYNQSEFRKFHHFGNRIITWMFNLIFRTRYNDILTGYRAFSRRFIQKVPLISDGFEVETELMVQVLEKGIHVKEVPIHFRNRPEGSHSKLNTIADGKRILLAMIMMLRDHRPLFTFSVSGMIISFIGAILWIIGVLRYTEGAIFSFLRSGGALLIVCGIGFFLVGLILNTINVRMRELFSLLRRK